MSIDFFQPVIRVQAATFSDYLSSVGGFMGLLAGASVISIMEIVFHSLKNFNKKKSKVVPIQRTGPNQVTLTTENHASQKFSENFTHFMKKSHIHGLRYTRDQRQTKCGRMFFILLVTSSLIISSILIVEMYQSSEKSPMATRIDDQMWTLDQVREIREFIENFSSSNPFRFLFRSWWFVLPWMEHSMNLIGFASTEVGVTQTQVQKNCEELFGGIRNFSWMFSCFSLPSLSVSSYFCDQTTFRHVNHNYKHFLSRDNQSYTDKSKRYSRISWLQEQNFCYERQSSVNLAPILALDGLCYIFNFNQGLWDENTSVSRWYLKYVQISSVSVSEFPKSSCHQNGIKWTALDITLQRGRKG